MRKEKLNIKDTVYGNLKVGIIVPVYKVEQFIRKCIDSIISQTYSNWLLFLVDDGSPDNCGAICDSYAVSDNRIKVIHKKNGGLVSAWKRGLEVLPSDIQYVTFVDSDDWITESFLEELVNKQLENRADIVVSRLCGVYPDGKKSLSAFPIKVKFYNRVEMEKELFPVLLYGGDFHKRGLPCSRCGKLIKKELMLDNLNYISEKTTYGEDLNITFPMFLDAKSIDMIENEKCLYMVRMNPNSMTRAYDRNMLHSIEHVYDSLFEIAFVKNEIAIFESQILADYLAASVQYYKNELLNPKGFKAGFQNIEEYIADNDHLKRAIREIDWSNYRKLNVVIIKAMDSSNKTVKLIVMSVLFILKRYRFYRLKRMS